MKTKTIHFLGVAIVAMFLVGIGCAESKWKVSGCTLVWEGSVTGKTETKCYKDWHSRPASGLSECFGENEKSGLLCYPRCRDGYSGVGPVCWQKCPPGYIDDGAFCRKNADIIWANNDACPIYDKCGLTFKRGCSKCPEGYKNDGCLCRKDAHIFAKDTYGRGAGTFMGCPSDKKQIGLLCYGDCPSGYTADGIDCNADKETCVQVPVKDSPDYSLLKPYCFKLESNEGLIKECFTAMVYADNEENAEALAHCQAANYTLTRLSSCDDLNSVCK